MSIRVTRFARLALLFVAGLSALSLFGLGGCNGTGAGPGIGGGEYSLTGAMVQDRNTGRTVAVARLYHNDTLLVDGQIQIDGASLATGSVVTVADTVISRDSLGDTVRYINTVGPVADSTLAFWMTSATIYAGDAVMIATLDTASDFHDTVVVDVVDTFSIVPDGITPQNRIVRANDVVTVDWAGSDNATTYVLAAVPADTAYARDGYVLYPATQTTLGTIPKDAFLHEGTSTLDTGLYCVYVYAISGSPDSALTANLLPTPLPSQLVDNIDHRLLKGRFGSIMVTFLDTVRVKAQ